MISRIRKGLGCLLLGLVSVSLSFSLSAAPSFETPAVIGVIVSEAEANGDFFYQLALNDNENDNVWIRLTDETELIDQFGQDLPIDAPFIGAMLVITCYEPFNTIKVLEAMLFYPADEENEDEEEKNEELS